MLSESRSQRTVKIIENLIFTNIRSIHCGPHCCLIHSSRSRCMAASPFFMWSFHWESVACLFWNYFICEIPTTMTMTARGNDSLFSSEEEDYPPIERRCLDSNESSLLPAAGNCYQFVKMQLNRGDAEQFCRDRWGRPLANVKIGKTQKSEVAPLFEQIQ